MSRSKKKTFKHTFDESEAAIQQVSSVIEIIQSTVSNQITNIVQRLVTDTFSFTGSNTRPGIILTPFTTSIITTKNNSVIKSDLILSIDCHWDNCFYLERTINSVTTEIGSGAPASPRSNGFVTAPYDNNNASTTNQVVFKIIDYPAVPSGTVIQYQIRAYGSTSAINLNKTTDDLNGVNYERTSSTVILMEI